MSASAPAPNADRLPPSAIVNANGTVTLPLAHPRTMRHQTFTELKFHRFTGADLAATAAVKKRKSVLGVALAHAVKLRAPVGKALFDAPDLSDAIDVVAIIDGFCWRHS